MLIFVHKYMLSAIKMAIIRQITFPSYYISQIEFEMIIIITNRLEENNQSCKKQRVKVILEFNIKFTFYNISLYIYINIISNLFQVIDFQKGI